MTKIYTKTVAESLSFVPPHPERTGVRYGTFDVTYREWPSRGALLKTIEMQANRARKGTDWCEWKPRKRSDQLSTESSPDNPRDVTTNAIRIICKYCELEISEYKGLWWTGSDFQCPDGEHNHEPNSK